jgi:P-type Ca2+ transporter type 2C
MPRMPAHEPQRTGADTPPRPPANAALAPATTTAPAPAPTAAPLPWHTLTSADVLERLGATRTLGLSSAEAAARLERYGPNRVAESARTSPWRLLFEQFKNLLVIILLVGAAISVVLGHGVEAAAITVIVLFAVGLGFVQEYRAERAMEALRKMAAPRASVLRDGKLIDVDADQVVPGDLLQLVTGDRIPADARLLEVVLLKTDEASLTGESEAVEKVTESLGDEKLPVGDRRNMAYAGTSVTYGRGRAVVTATGMSTEFGRIAGLLQTIEREETPLQRDLDRIGTALARGAFAIVALISLLGLLRGEPLLEILLFGVALAVAVVPEALPAVVTISLAIGVQKMVRRHALVRRLPAVETLGCTTVICSDKTGTLTRDEMTLREIFLGGRHLHVTGSGYEPKGSFTWNGVTIVPEADLKELLSAGALASDARLTHGEQGHDIQGDPTEGALVVAAAKAGLVKDVLDAACPRVAEIPFDPATKRMTTLHRTPQGPVAYAKGAAEVILAACAGRWTPEGPRPLAAEDREQILANARLMASRALRVLAVARKPTHEIGDAENGLEFLGLVGLMDPPRAEARSAIEVCRRAGIRVVMITGDHPVTAEAIAKELGLLNGQRIVTGADLDAMNDEVLAGEAEGIGVFARVSPAHKLRVVEALQSRGQIVAMTGDGVNDAPALKKADIGIAMGITGTDVTKEAAEMTLTDDNFTSIVAAVEEGRAIFGNIKKYLMYLLAANIGEIGIMTGAMLLGWPLPLSAVQILYVNLATDGLPALALAVDPPDPNIMGRPPRNPRTGIFTRPVVFLMLLGGAWSTLINLVVFGLALRSGRPFAECTTFAFACLVLVEFAKAFAYRSDRMSTFHRPFANRWLNLAVLWELCLLMLVIYVPFLHHPFRTTGLTREEWGVILVVALSVWPVLEVGKWVVRRGTFDHPAPVRRGIGR